MNSQCIPDVIPNLCNSFLSFFAVSSPIPVSHTAKKGYSASNIPIVKE